MNIILIFIQSVFIFITTCLLLIDNAIYTIALDQEMIYENNFKKFPIWMSVKSKLTPTEMEIKATAFVLNYPGYNLTKFDDEMCYYVIDTHYTQYTFVKDFTIGVMKSDFCRYLMVYHYGGVYMDSDVFFQKDPKDWMDYKYLSDDNRVYSNVNFMVGLEGVPNEHFKEIGFCGDIQVVQWTFAATKQHPILLHMMDAIRDRYYKDKSKFVNWYDAVASTGPCVMTNGIKWYFNLNNESIDGIKQITDTTLIVKDVFMGPLSFFNCGDKNIFVKSDCNEMTAIIHKYQGSWKHDLQLK